MNKFLFSAQGEACLRALLQYHILPGKMIYSDAVHGVQGVEEFGVEEVGRGEKVRYPIVHVESSTLLKGYDLGVDILRRGSGVEARINGFWGPHVLDVLARDGVVHVLDRVLVPPKMVGKETMEEDLVLEMLREKLDDDAELEKSRGEL